MLDFKIDSKKATQAAAHLIGRNNNLLNYMKMIKLLYLADRLALEKWGRPILGGSYYLLDLGPVTSEILDWIRGRADEIFWGKHILKKSYDVKVSRDPGIGKLSPIEIELLDRIDKKFKKYDQYELVKWCHDNLPEWRDPEGSSIGIDNEKLLGILGKSKKKIRQIKGELEAHEYFSKLLKC